MGAWRARLAGRLLHPGDRCSDSRVVNGLLLIAGFVVLAIVAVSHKTLQESTKPSIVAKWPRM